MRKTIRRQPYEIVCNRDFRSTIAACAETSGKRDDTWINPAIVEVFTDLHEMGYAHSVEAWRGDDLVGGLYGLALGGVFFGESMFARADDASKIALVDLVIRLQKSGFTILDTQFTNEHLLRFGAVEVPRGKYLDQMRTAIRLPVTFYAEPLGAVDVAGFLERLHGT